MSISHKNIFDQAPFLCYTKLTFLIAISSVSVAMKNLREKNHITVTKAGFIYLTDSGRAIAEMIYERHQLISSCLMKLGVSEKTAVEDACRIEHVISKESFDALKNHIKKMQKEQ